MRAYSLTIFGGAFLLFQVQPLIGRYILPWFGGSSAVWTICMLFFQVFLLAGYAYAHFSIRKLSGRAQAGLHLGLMALSLALLPIIPGEHLKPDPQTKGQEDGGGRRLAASSANSFSNRLSSASGMRTWKLK